nr:DUF4230 domain-containing protein [uncultured Dysosmobacter sp.]
MFGIKEGPVKTLRYLVVGVVLCAAVGLAGFLGGRYAASHQEAPQLSAVVLEGRLVEISELASVTYTYTNMAQFENSDDFYGMKIPFTTKKFILSYDGTIKAGIDLGDVEIEVRDNNVTVTLPEAEILAHEIDADSVEIFDEKTSIFNPFTIEDFTAFQAAQREVMEEKALQRGLLAQAREKAGNSVRLMLASVLPEEAQLTVQ